MDILAITPVTDLTDWLAGRGLEVVLIILGSVLLARLVSWIGSRLTDQIDRKYTGGDALVRSEVIGMEECVKARRLVRPKTLHQRVRHRPRLAVLADG